MVSAAPVMGTLLVVREMRQRAEGPLYPVSWSRSATVLPRANLRLGTKNESTRSSPPRTTATPTRATRTRAIMTSIAIPFRLLSTCADRTTRRLDGAASPAQYGASGRRESLFAKEDTMDRREILAEKPVERGRGFMPGISVNPSRVLFTAGLTGRGTDGKLVSGGMGPQTQRTFERLQAILGRAGARFDDVIKQLVYVTDIDAYNATGRAARAKFFGNARPASTGLVVQRLAESDILVEVELVVDLGGSPQGKPLLEKFNVEEHGGEFYQGVIVKIGRASCRERGGLREEANEASKTEKR